MNSSLLTPSSSSSSQIQPQSFEHDDFLDHIFSSAPWPSVVDDAPQPPPPPQSTTSDGVSFHHSHDDSAVNLASRLSQQQIMMMPLPIGNDSSNSHQNDVVDGSVQALYNGFAAAGAHSPPNPSLPFHLPQGSGGGLMNQGQGQNQAAQPQASASTATGNGGAPPQTKPKVRARRGQATDPHSIAERLRRERIAERMKALQELVPNANKTDKASMLDEIIDYVKFLQLQVKVLSMSRLGGAASVSSHISEGGDRGQVSGTHANSTNAGNQTATNTNNNDSLTMTEHQVAKLMEEDMGSAMQYLQGKGLCLMPISLATAISTATCHSRNPLIPGGNAATDGPPSPNVSVMTVQSTNTAPITNAVNDGPSSTVKDSTSVSKP